MCIKQEEARKTEDYCEGVLASVIDSLQRHYLSVKKMIEAQEEAAAAQVQSSMQTLQDNIKTTRKRSAELECLAQTDDDVLFLKVLLSHHKKLKVFDRQYFQISVSFLCRHRSGRLCKASLKKTMSFQRIHSSPLSSQRELLRSSGSNWRNCLTKSLPQSLKLVCVFADM